MGLLAEITPISSLTVKEYGDQGYQLLKKKICPFLNTLIQNEEADIRAVSRMRLGEIAPLLTEEDRNYIILPTCLQLVHDQASNDNPVAGLKLLGQLAPLFTKEFIEGFVTAELVAMSNEPLTNIRSQAVIQMANISNFIDQEKIISRLLPEFGRLAGDSSWEVRRAFVENMINFARLVPIEIRGRELSVLVLRLL